MNKIYMKVDPKDLWKFTFVEIMLGQMKVLFGIEEGVKRHKQFKLQRLKDRLKI